VPSTALLQRLNTPQLTRAEAVAAAAAVESSPSPPLMMPFTSSSGNFTSNLPLLVIDGSSCIALVQSVDVFILTTLLTCCANALWRASRTVGTVAYNLVAGTARSSVLTPRSSRPATRPMDLPTAPRPASMYLPLARAIVACNVLLRVRYGPILTDCL